jgi:hypothetical protein
LAFHVSSRIENCSERKTRISLIWIDMINVEVKALCQQPVQVPPPQGILSQSLQNKVSIGEGRRAGQVPSACDTGWKL